ncbi:hypothetical protein [Bacillus kexueae]|uniref:hypothetical protein n=1 Tax=Aeribacillus kexueae TaxID=2078952 RepID=UPI001FAEDD61|nr:hypothetical protein [Bacillus kexueae]
MQKISSEQFELFMRFYYLLDSIDEGIQYVIQSFENIEYTERDRVLTDIMLAFYEMDSSRHLMVTHMEENQLLDRLDELIHLLEEVDFIKQQPVVFENLVRYELYPTFTVWKQEVQKQLQTFITH